MSRYNEDIPILPYVGMKVRIRDLTKFRRDESPYLLGDMYNESGKISTIRMIYPNNVVDLIAIPRHWLFKWLEPVKEGNI